MLNKFIYSYLGEYYFKIGNFADAYDLVEVNRTIERVVNELFDGKLLFNPPTRMKVGVKERIEVRITKSFGDLIQFTSNLKGRGQPDIFPIKVGFFMKVKLSGENFRIRELSSVEQFITNEGFTQWAFDATPLKSGTQTLILLVTVQIKMENLQEVKDYPVLEKDVNVSINPIYSIKLFIEDLRVLFVMFLGFLTFLIVFLRFQHINIPKLSLKTSNNQKNYLKLKELQEQYDISDYQ